MIADGCMLSYRIVDKVIKCHGDSSFLGEQKGLYSKVTEEFNDTHNGIKIKDGRVIDVPLVMNFPPVFDPRDDNVTEGGEKNNQGGRGRGQGGRGVGRGGDQG